MLTGAALFLVAWLLLVATRDHLWWDGWAIWGLKARVLWLDGGLGSLLDPAGGYGFAHPDYPLGVPIVGWWLYAHAGGAEPALLSASGAVWFGLLVVHARDVLGRRVDAVPAALATLALAAFWPVAFYAIGGTADVVMALALLGAGLELVRVRTTERGDGPDADLLPAVFGATLFLALAALAKNEGVALALAGTAFLAWWGVKGAGSPRLLAPLALPLAAMAPWLLMRATHDLTTDVLSRPTAAGVAGRAPVVLEGLWIQLTVLPWLPLALLGGVGLVALARGASPSVRPGWGLLGAYAALVLGVYVTSSQPVAWLVVTSYPRVVGAMIPAWVVLATLSIFSGPGKEPPS